MVKKNAGCRQIIPVRPMSSRPFHAQKTMFARSLWVYVRRLLETFSEACRPNFASSTCKRRFNPSVEKQNAVNGGVKFNIFTRATRTWYFRSRTVRNEDWITTVATDIFYLLWRRWCSVKDKTTSCPFFFLHMVKKFIGVFKISRWRCERRFS